MVAFLNRRTFRQLILYGVVGAMEYAVAFPSYNILVAYGLTGAWAFTYTQVPVGLMGFLLRKFAVFHA